MKNDEFYEAIKNRRSIYNIGDKEIVSEKKIEEIVEYAVKHVPSAFNSQTGRIVLLFEEEHNKLWDICENSLREIVPEDKFASTEEKIDGFRSGYGTALFFEEMEIVKSLQERFPTYADNFPVWSDHSSGMLQYVIWTALEKEGLGASLQHYNELIVDQVKEEWDLPESWRMIAQMPFGNIVEGPDEKEFEPIEKRVKVFK
ncbi:MAG: nitroreductase family protein [Bacillota bacterium]